MLVYDIWKDRAFCFLYSSGKEKCHNYKVLKKHLEQLKHVTLTARTMSVAYPYTASRENWPGGPLTVSGCCFLSRKASEASRHCPFISIYWKKNYFYYILTQVCVKSSKNENVLLLLLFYTYSYSQGKWNWEGVFISNDLIILSGHRLKFFSCLKNITVFVGNLSQMFYTCPSN